MCLWFSCMNFCMVTLWHDTSCLNKQILVWLEVHNIGTCENVALLIVSLNLLWMVIKNCNDEFIANLFIIWLDNYVTVHSVQYTECSQVQDWESFERDSWSTKNDQLLVIELLSSKYKCKFTVPDWLQSNLIYSKTVLWFIFKILTSCFIFCRSVCRNGCRPSQECNIPVMKCKSKKQKRKHFYQTTSLEVEMTKRRWLFAKYVELVSNRSVCMSKLVYRVL